MQPQRAHDEEQLDAHRSKREHTRDKVADGRTRVVGHFGNETCDLIRLRGHLNLISTVAKIATDKHQWSRHTSPQQEDKEYRQERHGRGGTYNTQEDVQHHEHAHNHCGEGKRSGNRVSFPSLGITELVQPSRDVSTNHSAEDIQQHHCCQRLTLLDGVQHTKHRCQQCSKEGRTDLSATPNQHTKQHGIALGWAEDISVNQLPASLLLCLLYGLHFIVPSNILFECADHDGSNSTRQEDHNHERVDDGKIVDLIIR
mmetsp:Transcript_5514/g.8482  ORF Transcript_5514/g.8482 Transcript_5514/m.8482 type:complete len:257 (-) Transcript_5514:13-783(-)